MELRHLRYFLAVAEVENISLAARKLNISQPPLSRQIQQLEEELGCALFSRGPKALQLTEAGKVFAREAEEVIRRLNEGIAAARGAAAKRRRVRIGYAPSLTIAILPRILRALEKASYGIEPQLYDLSTREMLNKLQMKEIDIALIVHPGKSSLAGLEFRELDRMPACVVLQRTHSASKLTEVPIETVADDLVVALTKADYPEYHRWLFSLYTTLKVRPRIREEHESVHSLLAAVDAGRGIAFGGVGLKELCGDRLVVRRLAHPANPILVGAVYSPGSPFADCIAASQ